MIAYDFEYDGQYLSDYGFSIYNDNISELLQMYPTHQHLLINDTARLIVGLNGNPT